MSKGNELAQVSRLKRLTQYGFQFLPGLDLSSSLQYACIYPSHDEFQIYKLPYLIFLRTVLSKKPPLSNIMNILRRIRSVSNKWITIFNIPSCNSNKETNYIEINENEWKIELSVSMRTVDTWINKLVRDRF